MLGAASTCSKISCGGGAEQSCAARAIQTCLESRPNAAHVYASVATHSTVSAMQRWLLSDHDVATAGLRPMALKSKSCGRPRAAWHCQQPPVFLYIRNQQ